MPEEKIRLGVSACLLGEAVRWDGSHRRDAVVVETLGPRVQRSRRRPRARRAGGREIAAPSRVD